MNNYPKCIYEVPIPEIHPLFLAFKNGPQDHMECDGFTTTERELLDKCRRTPPYNFAKWASSRWTTSVTAKEEPLPPGTNCDISFNIPINIEPKHIYADIPLERTPMSVLPAFPTRKQVLLALGKTPNKKREEQPIDLSMSIKGEPMDEEITFTIQKTAETNTTLMNNLQRLRNMQFQ